MYANKLYWMRSGDNEEAHCEHSAPITEKRQLLPLIFPLV